jgi:hypothetical protein
MVLGKLAADGVDKLGTADVECSGGYDLGAKTGRGLIILGRRLLMRSRGLQ